jgi:hypothetical protein
MQTRAFPYRGDCILVTDIWRVDCQVDGQTGIIEGCGEAFGGDTPCAGQVTDDDQVSGGVAGARTTAPPVEGEIAHRMDLRPTPG